MTVCGYGGPLQVPTHDKVGIPRLANGLETLVAYGSNGLTSATPFGCVLFSSRFGCVSKGHEKGSHSCRFPYVETPFASHLPILSFQAPACLV